MSLSYSRNLKMLTRLAKSSSNCSVLSAIKVVDNSGSYHNGGGMSSKRTFSRSSCLRSADKIEVTVENGVRRIFINRPEAKNSLSFAMMEKLGNTLLESNTDNGTKIITLTGAGDFFSSGNDLNNWKAGTTEEIQEKSRKYVLRSLMYGFVDCRKPIIAMVNGGAVGAGATLLPFCDQILANDKAFFYTPFPALGIVPEFGSSYLFPKIMGMAKANDMLLFGHKLTAEEALQCGFISKLFPSDVFEESCQKLIDTYAKLPLEPLIKSKEVIRGPEREKLRQLCAYEMDYVIEACGSPYMKAMLEKFFSKKK